MSEMWRKRMRAALGVGAVVVVVFGTGCTPGSRDRSRPLHAAERFEPNMRTPVVHEARGLAMFDGESGSALDWDEVMARVGSSSAVLIGETHGHAQGGAVEVALFADLLAGKGGVGTGEASALSLEFFDRDQQTNVDDYLTGVTDDEQFRKRSARTEGNYPDAHRDMLEAAKAADRPVIASNAPRRYVSLAREDGFDRLRGLTEEQRSLFVIPRVMTEGAYRERFFDDMSQMMAAHMPQVEHKDPGEGDDSEAEAKQRNLDEAALAMIRKYYLAQNMWDATMAASVAAVLDRGLGPVVHVVGQFHVERNGGLVQRLRADRPGARILTVVLAPEDAPASGRLADEDFGRGDVVVYVGVGEE